MPFPSPKAGHKIDDCLETESGLPLSKASLLRKRFFVLDFFLNTLQDIKVGKGGENDAEFRIFK